MGKTAYGAPRGPFFEGVALMKKTDVAILASSLVCVILLVTFLAYPRYQEGRLLARLEQAESPEMKAAAIKEIILAGFPSATESLRQYAQQDPLVAFDPINFTGLVVDDFNGDVYEIRPVFGFSANFKVGSDDPLIFQEVQLLYSNDRQATFLLKSSSEDSKVKYHRFAYLFHDGESSPYGTVQYDVSPDDIARWKVYELWPF